MKQQTFTPLDHSQKCSAEETHDKYLFNQAWEWLYKSRKNAPANADIWDLRFKHVDEKDIIYNQLLAGSYQLSPMQIVGKSGNALWSSRDALVLKWVALKLTGLLPLHECCEHVKGHGGGRASVQRVDDALKRGDYHWVCRTDIKGYYGSIQKDLLLNQLRETVSCHVLLKLLSQYLHYSVENGGVFHTPEKGIARGCALSPLMGALHLWAVDNHFSRQRDIYYARYMDDFIILTKKRCQLRRQVKALNGYFNQYGFCQHPDKIFIGRTSGGFDWMGAQMSAEGVTGIAPRALANHFTCIRRLYEQAWLTRRMRETRVSEYRRKWAIWAASLSVGWLSPVAANTVLTDGWNHVGSAYANLTTSGNGSSSQLYKTPLGTIIAITADVGGSADCKDAPTTTSLDGYYGVEVSPGVLLVIYSSRVEGQARDAGDSTYSTYWRAWNEKGAPSGQSYGPSWCADHRWDISRSINQTGKLKTTGQMNFGIYVKPGTNSQTNLSLPPYRLCKASNGGLGACQTLPFTSGKYDINPASCTVTTPSAIQFGDISPGVDVPPVPVEVSYTCVKAPAMTLNVSTSITPRVPGNAWSFPLTSARGAVAGDIVAGKVGADNLCSFNPTAQWPVDGSAIADSPGNQAGMTTVVGGFSIEWKLCPRVDAQPGPASAIATIDVSW